MQGRRGGAWPHPPLAKSILCAAVFHEGRILDFLLFASLVQLLYDSRAGYHWPSYGVQCLMKPISSQGTAARHGADISGVGEAGDVPVSVLPARLSWFGLREVHAQYSLCSFRRTMILPRTSPCTLYLAPLNQLPPFSDRAANRHFVFERRGVKESPLEAP